MLRFIINQPFYVIFVETTPISVNSKMIFCFTLQYLALNWTTIVENPFKVRKVFLHWKIVG